MHDAPILPGQQMVGTCSLCGGPVTVHSPWFCVIPDTPTCQRCGATAAPHGPTIPMVPSRPLEYLPRTRPVLWTEPEPGTGGRSHVTVSDSTWGAGTPA